MWQEYENDGWPARYLFDGHARLFEYHYGEGAYAETELAIQELLGRRARAAGAAAPRGRPRRACWRPRPRTSPAPTRGRTRPAACGRCSTGAGTVRVERRRATRGRPSGRLPADRARAPHRGRARAGDRAGRASATRRASRRAWLDPARHTRAAWSQVAIGVLKVSTWGVMLPSLSTPVYSPSIWEAVTTRRR